MSVLAQRRAQSKTTVWITGGRGADSSSKTKARSDMVLKEQQVDGLNFLIFTLCMPLPTNS